MYRLTQTDKLLMNNCKGMFKVKDASTETGKEKKVIQFITIGNSPNNQQRKTFLGDEQWAEVDDI